MDDICITLVLDLEESCDSIPLSLSDAKSLIEKALFELFGEVGASIPFELEVVDSNTKIVKVILHKSQASKLRCAISLVSKYRNVDCCFRTVSIETVTQ